MNPLIKLTGLEKHFKVLNRREGLMGAIKDLFSRNFRTIKAVDGIDLSIMAGEIVGFLGPNGAGKSTTIKMMTGVLEPSGGLLEVNGMVPCRDRIRYVRGIGVVFGQRTQLWWELPVIESFKLMKEIFCIPNEMYESNLKRLDDLVGISKLYHQQVRSLSLGQRMLCDIAASFLHNPAIIFLDEPTIGLDVAVKSQIRKLIRTLNQERNTTILLTTHDLGDVEALCERIVLIDQGKIIYDGKSATFNRIFGSYRTLKLLPREGAEAELAAGLPTIADKFQASLSTPETKSGEAASGEESATNDGWLAITIDQDKTPLADVLSYCLSNLPVQDVKIQEISTESVITKVYAGALA